MNINVFSVLMSVLFSMGFILMVHLLRKKEFSLRSYGIPLVLFLCGLCLCRMVFTIELPFTQPIRLETLLNSAYMAIREKKEFLPGLQLTVLELLGYFWLGGAIITCAAFLLGYLKNLFGLSKYRGNSTSDIESMLQTVQEESGSSLRVSVCICPEISIPMGAGIVKKRIYLPAVDFSGEELYYILKHEYAHFLGHDLIVKLLICLFCCVYWWNPAVYVLKRDIDQILEIRADISATKDFSKDAKLGYLTVILELMKAAKATRNRFFRHTAAPLFAEKDSQALVERFRIISKPIKRTRLVRRIAFVLISLLVFIGSYSFVFQPAYEPPVEEVYTDNSVQKTSLNGAYILQLKDKSYVLVLEDGSKSPMKREVAEMFFSDGIPLKKEE